MAHRTTAGVAYANGINAHNESMTALLEAQYQATCSDDCWMRAATRLPPGTIEKAANKQKLAFRQVLQAAQLMGGRIGIFLKGWMVATTTQNENAADSCQRCIRMMRVNFVHERKVHTVQKELHAQSRQREASLEAQCRQSIAQVETQMREKLRTKDEAVRQLSQEVALMGEQHEAKVKGMQREFRQENERLQATLTEKLKQAEATAEAEKLKQDLTHNSALASNEEELDRLKEAHKKELQDMQEQLEALRLESAKRTQDATRQLQEEHALAMRRKDDEINDLLRRHRQELDNIQSQNKANEAIRTAEQQEKHARSAAEQHDKSRQQAAEWDKRERELIDLHDAELKKREKVHMKALRKKEEELAAAMRKREAEWQAQLAEREAQLKASNDRLSAPPPQAEVQPAPAPVSEPPAAPALPPVEVATPSHASRLPYMEEVHRQAMREADETLAYAASSAWTTGGDRVFYSTPPNSPLPRVVSPSEVHPSEFSPNRISGGGSGPQPSPIHIANRASRSPVDGASRGFPSPTPTKDVLHSAAFDRARVTHPDLTQDLDQGSIDVRYNTILVRSAVSEPGVLSSWTNGIGELIWEVYITVSNVGNTNVKETVQLHVEAQGSYQRLIGFTHIQIEPGASEIVVIPVQWQDVATLHTDGSQMQIRPGNYNCIAGANSRRGAVQTTVAVS